MFVSIMYWIFQEYTISQSIYFVFITTTDLEASSSGVLFITVASLAQDIRTHEMRVIRIDPQQNTVEWLPVIRPMAMWMIVCDMWLILHLVLSSVLASGTEALLRIASRGWYTGIYCSHAAIMAPPRGCILVLCFYRHIWYFIQGSGPTMHKNIVGN